jgi:hypothetical protein
VKATTNPALLQWILGRQYPVIGTDFYFMALRDESKLRECVHRLAVPRGPCTPPPLLFLSFFCLLVSAVAGVCRRSTWPKLLNSARVGTKAAAGARARAAAGRLQAGAARAADLPRARARASTAGCLQTLDIRPADDDCV